MKKYIFISIIRITVKTNAMFPNEISRVNSSGPSTEPCGMP